MTTTEPVPTVSTTALIAGCPPWCRLEVGHAGVVSPGGGWRRLHYGSAQVPGVGHVDLEVFEVVSPAGRVECDPVQVVTDSTRVSLVDLLAIVGSDRAA